MAGITREERARRAALANEQGGAPPAETATAAPVDPAAPAVDAPPSTPEPPKPPMFSVAERRLKHGDVAMMRQAAEFELVGLDEPMSIYWGLTEDAHELITLRGWVPVHSRYLPMKANRMGLTEAPDGNVTRGKNGSEMLFMMPKRLREEILFDQANRRQVMRLSRRTWQKQTQESMQAAASDPNLSPEQREKAARAAASIDGQRAKWSFTEFTESHSRNSVE